MFFVVRKAFSFLWLLVAVAGQELAELLDDTEVVKGFDWEWVLIRVDGVAGPLSDADYPRKSAADAQVVVTALNAVHPDIEFDTTLSKYHTAVVGNDDTPEWFVIGMVSYKKDSVSQLEVVFKDDDVLADDDFIKTTINIIPDYDKWVEVSLTSQDGYLLNISLWRSTTPVFTEEEQETMNLTEKVFDLEDGSKAVLTYSLAPSNQKAVLYFPGKEDAFTHPNVRKLYQEKGYDLFALDPRFCGRARRFMDDYNFRQAHSIANFDTYREEVALALDFIQSQNKTYTKPLAHVHSTGALVALNYAMLMDEEPFEGYILNGPFLDWGHQSKLNEFLLEHSGVVSWFGVDNAKTTGSLTKYHVDNWILHRFNTSDRPIISGDTTLQWAKACTNVHNKILNTPRSSPITNTPVLLIASRGDVVLTTSESVDRMPHIATNYSKAILKHQSHDVTYSATKGLCEEAIGIISDWLDNPEPTEFSSGKSLGRGGYAAWLGSWMLGLFVLL